MMMQTLYWPVEGDKEQVRHIREGYQFRWYRNGGYVTHNSLKHTRKNIRQEIFEYIDNLPVNIELEVNGKRYLLTHAAPMEEFLKGPSKYADAKMYAVWHRYTGEEKASDDRIVIFGHTGTYHYQDGSPARIWHGDGLIGIDCGCAYIRQPGDTRPQTRLACLRLDDMKEFYSES